MPTRKKPRKASSARKRSAPLRSGTSDTRRTPAKLNGHGVPEVAGRIMRIYTELPLRLARCRTPFEFFLEQCLVAPRVIAALQPDPA